jgi:hypothetical protein
LRHDLERPTAAICDDVAETERLAVVAEHVGFVGEVTAADLVEVDEVGARPKDAVDLPTTRTRPRLEWADSSKGVPVSIW